jgi:small-conductance mechanosensitive channel
MNQITDYAGRAKRFLRRVAQWTVFLVLLLFALVMMITHGRFHSVPDYPAELLTVVIVALIIAAVTIFPPIFFRLPRALKYGAYIMFGTSVFLGIFYFAEAESAYETTPKGREEAAEAADWEAMQQRMAEDENARKTQEAEELAVKANAERIHGQLTRCLSFLGSNIPDLADRVKASLENPHSFEHVSTDILNTATGGHNVSMTFRAENGFGALRTARVQATVDPSSCTVTDIGTFEND